MAFSPDGTMLASTKLDGTIRLWNPETGHPIGNPLDGHSSLVNVVTFSPDGAMLASAGADGMVQLWNSTTGDPISDAQPLQSGFVNDVAFSPDGTMLASAGADGTVRLWDPARGDPIAKRLEGHTGALQPWAVAFSPDGTMLASASRWDGAAVGPRQRPVDRRPDRPPPRVCVAVAFSPDGTMLASAGDDGTVRLWDPNTGDPIGDPSPATPAK